MIVRDMMPRKESLYLSAVDLEDKPHVVVISEVKSEPFKDRETGETKQKPILYFQGKKKKLTLNMTNIISCEQIIGSGDSDAWVGKSIELFPTTCLLKGDITPCIRVRPPSVQQAPAPVAATPAPAQPDPMYGEVDDDIPF